ncbi:hypothetical protein ABFS82_04G033000 [Erythranthe guttata]|nr:PREDICTED: protein ELC-like [Erythranthe guttata]|eukprot:XP_012837170.1 PREDICTED: protein ELC-like [Erythranthe guttata]
MLSYIMDSFKSFSNYDDMGISDPDPIKFIEDALFCSSPLALSYSDPDQKWIIRQHLISLFQDFPCFKPSVDVFTYNDGTEVKLLNASGKLTVSQDAPPVPVTIWVPEYYPEMAPIVYVDSGSPLYPIYENHPFSNCSGETTCPYLENWRFSKCDLSGLTRNLKKLFSHNHPFYYSGSGSSNPAHPSTFSKMEAIDRLAAAIHYDAAAITAEYEEEIENLSAIQIELQERGEALKIVVNELEREKKRFKGRTEEMCGESDKLMNWLKVYDGVSDFPIDDVFEGVDKESEIELECSAADLAAEDLMYALEKAVEEGVLGFEAYFKQVRVLAREQFLCRAKILKIKKLL